MKLVLDASAVVAWYITRNDPSEAALAQQAVLFVMSQGATVPTLWFVEVANAILTVERRKISDPQSSALFLADLDALPIATDNHLAGPRRTKILDLGRSYKLTAYDATYLELALRTKASLATFDSKLADAFRAAGGHVFGDAP